MADQTVDWSDTMSARPVMNSYISHCLHNLHMVIGHVNGEIENSVFKRT